MLLLLKSMSKCYNINLIIQFLQLNCHLSKSVNLNFNCHFILEIDLGKLTEKRRKKESTKKCDMANGREVRGSTEKQWKRMKYYNGRPVSKRKQSIAICVFIAVDGKNRR